MDGSEINRRALALQRMTMDAMLDKVRELEREIVDLRHVDVLRPDALALQMPGQAVE